MIEFWNGLSLYLEMVICHNVYLIDLTHITPIRPLRTDFVGSSGCPSPSISQVNVPARIQPCVRGGLTHIPSTFFQAIFYILVNTPGMGIRGKACPLGPGESK